MKRLLAPLIAAAVLASPAFAQQCMPGAVQTAATLAAMVQQDLNRDVAFNQITQLARDCPKQPHVQKLAGLAYASTLSTIANPQKLYDQALAGWNYVLAMRASRGDSEAPVDVMLAGQMTRIDVYANDKFEADVLQGLLVAETRSGKFHPDHQPLVAGEAMRSCGKWELSDAQVAAFLIQENPRTEIPAARNALDRAIAACSGAMDKNLNDNLLALRARTFMMLVKDNPDRPDAQQLLDVAQTDAMRFHELNPQWDRIYFAESDAQALDKLVAIRQMAASPTPPEEEWFSGANPDNPKVIAAIAARLDAAWAKDEPQWAAGGFRTYRDTLGAFYSKAMTSKNVVPARQAIYAAAKGHADGSMRSAGTQALREPPGFLWTWIEPKAE